MKVIFDVDSWEELEVFRDKLKPKSSVKPLLDINDHPKKLYLSTRACNFFGAQEITTIEQLTKIPPKRLLLAYPGLGSKTASEIIIALYSQGFHYMGDPNVQY
jgi:DNA-directed RNA polymerase alpha subunit